MKSNQKIVLLLAVVLTAVLVVFAAVWFSTRPATSQGGKTITVEVVHKDESKKTFTCHTDEEYLGPVLDAENIAQGEEGPYGLYIKFADGEKAVYEEDGAFWALKKDGEDTPASADQTPIQDGDAFSLVYTVA